MRKMNTVYTNGTACDTPSTPLIFAQISSSCCFVARLTSRKLEGGDDDVEKINLRVSRVTRGFF